MGGSTDVDAAFQWMIERSGGGDVVILRASGTDAYNPYIKALGKVNSVETLKIDSRRLAQDDGVARIIRGAEMLFIAGGDQAQYVEYWKDTKVMDAINDLIRVKKIPVAGTSAGAAVLGGFYFSGERGSVTSQTALANPYAREITLHKQDFVDAPLLKNVLIDQHFSQRERQGRMLTFLGRIMTDWKLEPRGIAVDEKTAVCIDENGVAQVMGENKAWFLKTDATKPPESLAANQSLTWNHNGKAVWVAGLSAKDANRMNVRTFEYQTPVGSSVWWSTIGGKLFFIND